MQNSNTISLQKGVDQLKQMFPNFDEDVIFCVLVENHNEFEKAVDALLMMNGSVNKLNREEPEISIFRNKPSMANYDTYSNKINEQVNRRENINKNETSLEKQENNNNNNNKSNDNVNKLPMKTVANSVEIKKKNSFGQKFKSK
jgi:hypothetical protein